MEEGTMRALPMGMAVLMLAVPALAEIDRFDAARPGAPPADWLCGVTGSGAPRWEVVAEAGAPSGANVLKQSGTGTFPWCVKRASAIADGHVEVKFKPIAGREDQAAGVVWRWKDANTYYVARANALENNVALYYTERGRRITIVYVDAPVRANAWQTLRVEFAGTRIRVLLDGRALIERDDARIAGPGAVGVWTKADSVTAFDDFDFAAR
jgi:hypothetical protein